MPDSTWQNELNRMASEKLDWTFSIRDPARPAEEIAAFQAGAKYEMLFAVINRASEVVWENVEARLVATSPNPPIEFFSDVSYATKVPRVGVDMGTLQGAGTPGSMSVQRVYIRSNITAPRSIPLLDVPLFGVGLYATAKPEGHFWSSAVI